MTTPASRAGRSFGACSYLLLARDVDLWRNVIGAARLARRRGARPGAHRSSR